jgi:hypothetical protein
MTEEKKVKELEDQRLMQEQIQREKELANKRKMEVDE